MIIPDFNTWSINEGKVFTENAEILSSSPYPQIVHTFIKRNSGRGTLKEESDGNSHAISLNNENILLKWRYRYLDYEDVFYVATKSYGSTKQHSTEEKGLSWYDEYTIRFISKKTEDIKHVASLMPKTFSFKRRGTEWFYEITEKETTTVDVYETKLFEVDRVTREPIIPDGSDVEKFINDGYSDYNDDYESKNGGIMFNPSKMEMTTYVMKLIPKEKAVFTYEDLISTDEFKAMNASCISTPQQQKRLNLVLSKKFDINRYIPEKMIINPPLKFDGEGMFFLYNRGAGQWAGNSKSDFEFDSSSIDGWKAAFKKMTEETTRKSFVRGKGKVKEIFKYADNLKMPNITSYELLMNTRLEDIKLFHKSIAIQGLFEEIIPEVLAIKDVERQLEFAKQLMANSSNADKRAFKRVCEIPSIAKIFSCVAGTLGAILVQKDGECRVSFDNGSKDILAPANQEIDIEFFFKLKDSSSHGYNFNLMIYPNYQMGTGTFQVNVKDFSTNLWINAHSTIKEIEEFKSLMTTFLKDKSTLEEFIHLRRGHLLVQDLGIGED